MTNGVVQVVVRSLSLCGVCAIFAFVTTADAERKSLQTPRPGLTVEVNYGYLGVQGAGFGVVEDQRNGSTIRGEIRKGTLTIDNLHEGYYNLVIIPYDKEHYMSYLRVGVIIKSGDSILDPIVLPKKKGASGISVSGKLSDAHTTRISIQKGDQIRFPKCGKSAPVNADGSFEIQLPECKDYHFEISATNYHEITARVPDEVNDEIFVFANVEIRQKVTISYSEGGPSNTGIGGKITDFSGALVVNAAVSIRNVLTNEERATTTDNEGSFQIGGLKPGDYEVTVTAHGFTRYKFSVLHVGLSQVALVTIPLSIANSSSTVEVTTFPLLIETTSTEVVQTVGASQLDGLPLNARNISSLFYVAPSASGKGNESGVISVNGAESGRTDAVRADALQPRTVEDSFGSLMLGIGRGSDTVQEMRVITEPYGAGYGGSAGGQRVLTGKTGGNSLQGNLFEYFGNEILNARNSFDRLSDVTPSFPGGGRRIAPFRRNQYGGSFGGPIRKDHTFFYVAYDGVIALVGNPDYLGVENVPPTSCHAPTGVVDNVSCLGLPPANSGQTPVATNIPALLALFPQPNLVNNQFVFFARQDTSANFGSITVDHKWSDSTDLFARYMIDDSDEERPRSFSAFQDAWRNRTQHLTLSGKHDFSKKFTNSSSLSYFRTSFLGKPLSTTSGATVELIPGHGFGELQVGGFTALGSDPSPGHRTANVFSLQDDLSVTKGKHRFSAGALINHYQYGFDANFYPGGLVRFANTQDFILGHPQFVFTQDPASDTRRFFSFNTVGLYGQYKYSTQALTVDMGLRYEFYTVPREGSGREFAFRNLLDNTLAQTTKGPIMRNASLRNLSPRLGFTWKLPRPNKIVVKGGGAIYYDIDEIGRALIANTLGTPPLSSEDLLFPTSFSAPLDFNDASRLQVVQTFDFSSKQPSLSFYNLAIERELPSKVVVEIGYAGSRGRHLFTLLEGNPTVPAFFDSAGLPVWTRTCKPTAGNSCRINPSVNAATVMTTKGDSWYNSMRLDVRKALSRGLQFQSSYTWSKLLSTVADTQATGTDGSGNNANPFNVKNDKGPSALDTKHKWSLSLWYSFPRFGGESKRAKFFQDWSVGNTVFVESGRPFSAMLAFNNSNSELGGPSADRASVVTAANLAQAKTVDPQAVIFDPNTVILGNPAEWFNVHMFTLPLLGHLGDSSRGLLRGPGSAEWDLSVNKSFELHNERGKFTLKFNFINLLNRSNFSLPNNAIFLGVASVSPTAGQITSTVTPARQFSVGLKFDFTVPIRDRKDPPARTKRQ